eukprot:TRINITY_DN8228_c0_g1_i1.p1 TRINITY_DN8228_c0_g1~~TRINITY_DN8228_c0_g1_i1.p1  ORF type:complete len:347 (-),score=51.88 TRINITY_DN8228_c0_g1_i1:178-1179(-)
MEDGSIVVLGGTGFIGQTFVKFITNRKESGSSARVQRRRVFVLTRNGSDENITKIRNELGAEPLVGDLLAQGDVDSTGWKQTIHKASYVVYSAQPDFDPDDANGSGHLEKRLQMLRRVLSAIDKSRIQRFLLVSGSSYLGASTTDLNEDSVKGTPMGIGPILAKEIELLQSELSSTKYIVGLVGAVYGSQSWFTQMYLQGLKNEGGPQPVLMHDPSPVWPYIHVEDVARALEFLLFLDSTHTELQRNPLVVLSHELLKMDDFVHLLANQLGVTPSFSHVSREQMVEMMLPPILVDYLSSNLPHRNDKLRRLGFEFKYKSTKDGIASLVQRAKL